MRIPSLDDSGKLPEKFVPARLTEGALDASTAPPTNSLQDFIGLIRAGQRDLNVVIEGDSTVMSVGNAWGLSFPQALHDMFPTHTVKRRLWDYDGTGLDYLPVDQTIAGTGPRTINVWVAGAPGRHYSYHTTAVRRAALLASKPDLLMIDHGHNLIQVADPTDNTRDYVSMSIERIRRECPQAAVAIMSQNPRPDVAGRSEKMADIYRRICADQGYTFIDVTQAFNDDGRAIADLVLPEATPLHPNPAGFAIWLAEVMKAFRSRATSQPIPRRPPSLDGGGRNYVTNPTLDATDYTAIPGWTLGNCTAAKVTDPAFQRSGKGFVVKLTKVANTASAYAHVVLPIEALRGKRVTATVPQYMAAAEVYANVGQVQFRTTGGTVLASSWTDASNNRDEWTYRTLTWDVPSNQSSLVLRINVDPSASSNPAALYLDEVFLTVGSYPNDTAITPPVTQLNPPGTVDVQTFTANGTWTKPAGAKSVRVDIVGPGGGGGSGRRGAAGTLRTAGAGGGGGGAGWRTFPASTLPDTVAVAISAPGQGGAAVATDDTNGVAGGSGGSATFGSYLRIFGGAPGAGGNSSGAAAGGVNGTGIAGGATGASSSATGAAGSNATSSTAGAGAGGSGGGITTADATSAGGSGSACTTGAGTGAGTGGAAGAAAGAATGSPANSGIPGPGGGGGGSSAAGSAGGLYGGGGGGGGASVNGTASGAGGAGGPGICIVTTYF